MKKRILCYLSILIFSTTSILGCGDSSKTVSSEATQSEVPSVPSEAVTTAPEPVAEINVIEETPLPDVVETAKSVTPTHPFENITALIGNISSRFPNNSDVFPINSRLFPKHFRNKNFLQS